MPTDQTITTTAPPDVYRRRRTTLAAQLSRPLLLCAGYAPARNYAANAHHFRAGSSYLYYGGPPVQGAALLLNPGSNGRDGCTLLRPPHDPDDVVWEGPAPSDQTLTDAAGLRADAVEEPSHLAGVLGDRAAGFIAPPCLRTHKWLSTASAESANPDELTAIIDQRLCKDEHELVAMRRAADVTIEAHRAAMAATAPGRTEAQVAGAFHRVLVSHECQPSFTPIVTVRGEVLHLHGYPNSIESGRLMLVDAGAEEPGGYASDVTRTYPVDGKWTRIQRHLYETVLRSQQEAIAACAPGARYRNVHDLAARVICEGLVEAELLRGEPADLAARYAHTLFFCHGLGHLIGLDVHDMEDFGDLAGYAPGRSRRPEFGNKFLRLDRDLAPGMCVTVEPGIYLVPAIWQRQDLTTPYEDAISRKNIEALLNDRFGGIRIEETVCVTEGEPEVLTAGLPNDPDAVCELVGKGLRN